MTQPTEQVPPNNPEAEQSVISSCMIDPEAFALTRDRLQPDSFYQIRHHLIFQAMCDVYDEESSDLEPLTLANRLRRVGELEEAGGEEYLYFLVGLTYTGRNIEAHLRLVEEAASLRGLIRMSQEVSKEARAYTPSEEVVEKAEEALSDLALDRRAGGFQPLKESMLEAVDRVAALDGTGQLAGLSTGYEDLDRLTGGFEAGDYILLAGRPSEGKTALGLQLAKRVADLSGRRAAIISAEMSRAALSLRLIASEAHIPVHSLRMGEVADWSLVGQAMTRLDEIGLLVDDTPNLTIEQVRLRLRQIRKAQDVGVILIDYLQLLSAPRAQSREQEISQISRGIKGIAKEMDVPVIAISQLNRGIESRVDRRPRLSDLRESGSLEQDSDLVFFLYHPAKYTKGRDDAKKLKGVTELICAKQRNGPVGSVVLNWQEKWATFEAAAPEYREEQARWWVDL